MTATYYVITDISPVGLRPLAPVWVVAAYAKQGGDLLAARRFQSHAEAAAWRF